MKIAQCLIRRGAGKRSYAPALGSLALVLTIPTSLAGSILVSQIDGTGPGTLPAAIAQANAGGGAQTIEFGVSGVIRLSSPLPPVTADLTINGPSDDSVTVSGGSGTALFTFAPGATSTLSHLKLIDANTVAGGGAINNAGNLTLDHCELKNDQAPGGSGGAVKNTGTLVIRNSVISGNAAATGGAIYNAGNLELSDSVVSENQAGNGGAVFNQGNLQIARLTVSDNQATLGFGGAFYSSGTLTGDASTLDNNVAVGGTKGAVALHSQGAGGGGAGLGGSIFLESGTASLTNCTFWQNRATGGMGSSGGGTLENATVGGGNGGGAVYGGAGSLGGGGGGGVSGLITRGNGGPGGLGGFGGGGGGGGGGSSSWSVGILGTGGSGGAGGVGGGQGGTGGPGTANLDGEGGGGGGGAGMGGAIFAEGGELALVNCTLAGNTATGGPGGMGFNGSSSGQDGQGIGGGIYNYGGIIRLLNTIIAGNGGQTSSSDFIGIVFSSGYNLIGDVSGALGFQSTDLQSAVVHLAPLQDNGGPTWTCALQSDSPAIGRATNFGAPPTDQRGVPRSITHVDIGAYQMGSVPLAFPTIEVGPSSQTANYGDSVSFMVSASPGPLTYQWRRNSVNLPGQTQPTLVLPRVTFADAATYDVIVLNSSGSARSAGAVLSVQIPPGAPTIVAQPQDVVIRTGENSALSVQATSPSGALVYQWYQGQTGDVSHPVPGATGASYNLSDLNVTSRFWVSVHNSAGTVDSASASVSVVSAAAPKLWLESFNGQPGLIIDGQIGTVYRIEFASDPAHGGWAKLIDFSLPTAPFTYIDSTGVGAHMRFYRLVVP